MRYSLYKLFFTTGVHIGGESGGRSLGSSRMTIRSDTLFSALCAEFKDDSSRWKFYDLVKNGDITFSDALPFCGEEIYLPKPIIYSDMPRQDTDLKDSNRKKEFKSLEFIPFSMFDTYMDNFNLQNIDPKDLKKDFGIFASRERAAIKEGESTLPYSVAYFRFQADCGLYVIAKFSDEGSARIFETLLENLGISGIGGKQSSGFGKFFVKQVPLPSGLEERLNDENSSRQMLLNTALPKTEEKETIKNAFFSIVRRGGYVRSVDHNSSGNPLKKKTVYFLSSGSCFKTRFEGDILNVGIGGKHPVWRAAKSLFIGIKTKD